MVHACTGNAFICNAVQYIEEQRAKACSNPPCWFVQNQLRLVNLASVPLLFVANRGGGWVRLASMLASLALGEKIKRKGNRDTVAHIGCFIKR